MNTRKISFFLLVSFVFAVTVILAQEHETHEEGEDITIRPGMELKKLGGINMLVPEDTQVYRDRGRWIMEGPDEYAARRFKDVETRLQAVESEQEKLRQELERLKGRLQTRIGGGGDAGDE